MTKLEYLRHKAQTDLYWLAKEILGYDLVPTVHGPVCQFFVQKDPTRAIEEQDSCKSRLLLDPRGHFKTTLSIADAIQWILCFPNIRIGWLSGTQPLASRAVAELKNHFCFNKKLLRLFPEYAMNPDDSPADEFVTPARTIFRREPTIFASTLGSVKAGSHMELFKGDDLVNENNVGTRDQMQKTTLGLQHLTYLLDPGTYRDLSGTRYDFGDTYGHTIDTDEGYWKIFKRAACRIENDRIVDILFPQRFTEEVLYKQWRENPSLFAAQMLNDPHGGDQQLFDEDMILKHMIPHPESFKEHYTLFMAWDLALTTGSRSDYTVGAVGMFDAQGRLYVHDIIRGRFSPDILSKIIWHTAMAYRPLRLGIEDSTGSRLLAESMRTMMSNSGLWMPIDWLPVSRQKDAKQARIGSLQIRLFEDRLFFNPLLKEKEALVKEFVRFPKYSHDDIPDAISHLEFYSTKIDTQSPYIQLEAPIIAGGVVSEGLGAGLVG